MQLSFLKCICLLLCVSTFTLNPLKGTGQDFIEFQGLLLYGIPEKNNLANLTGIWYFS